MPFQGERNIRPYNVLSHLNLFLGNKLLTEFGKSSQITLRWHVVFSSGGGCHHGCDREDGFHFGCDGGDGWRKNGVMDLERWKLCHDMPLIDARYRSGSGRASCWICASLPQLTNHAKSSNELLISAFLNAHVYEILRFSILSCKHCWYSRWSCKGSVMTLNASFAGQSTTFNMCIWSADIPLKIPSGLVLKLNCPIH